MGNMSPKSRTPHLGSDATQFLPIFVPHVQILSVTVKLNSITLKVYRET